MNQQPQKRQERSEVRHSRVHREAPKSTAARDTLLLGADSVAACDRLYPRLRRGSRASKSCSAPPLVQNEVNWSEMRRLILGTVIQGRPPHDAL